MSKYKSYNSTKQKVQNLWLDSSEDLFKSKRIEKKTKIVRSTTFIKKTLEVELNFDTLYYDLYNWLGTTYQGGGLTSPEPASAYIENPEHNWYFKYPVFDFRVPNGVSPTVIVKGTTEEQWEYTKTIGLMKQKYHFDLFPDWAIPYIKIKTYVYSENDADIPVEVEDLSMFHRWVKKEKGYDFEFYGFFTIPEDKQLFLHVSLVAKNGRIFDALQRKQI